MYNRIIEIVHSALQSWEDEQMSYSIDVHISPVFRGRLLIPILQEYRHEVFKDFICSKLVNDCLLEKL